jgi:hypothetical protein
MIRTSVDNGPATGFRYDVVVGALVHLRLATAIAHATGTQSALVTALRHELAAECGVGRAVDRVAVRSRA